MDTVYLDSAATNLVHPRVLEVARRFIDALADRDRSPKEVFAEQKGSLGTARADVARFLGCSPKEIALMQSTSHSLGTLSMSLPLSKGDNILVCDLEYQASIVCWQSASERIGFEVREVKTTGGVITAEDFARYMDARTKVILLAAVQEINGFRADVRAIGKLAHSHGCIFIVDGIQEAGALAVNVKDLDMDIYCAGGKKWMGNPFGLGFMYIREELLSTLRPPYYSYYDIEVPETFHDYISYLEDPRRHPFDHYTLSQDASTFEAGGYGNFLGAAALSEAVHVLSDIGIENIEAHNLALNQRLYQGLSAIGLNMQSPGRKENMSSIIVFNFFGLRENNIDTERALLAYLHRRGILVSLRCSTGIGGIRVSVHYYTTEREVDIFIDAVQDFIREKNISLGER